MGSIGIEQSNALLGTSATARELVKRPHLMGALRAEVLGTPPLDDQDERRQLVTYLLRACDIMDIEDRDPDAWEEKLFTKAAASLAANRLDAAWILFAEGLRSPHDRPRRGRERRPGK